MKINVRWDEKKKQCEIDIISNPTNQAKIELIRNHFEKSELVVVDPRNNRKRIVDLSKIEVVMALGHMSQIILETGEKLFLSKNLKQLEYLEEKGFYRINNQMILNMNIVNAFQSGSYARLEVVTNSKQTYIVSRHYSKQIKEKMKW